ncbi:MAG: hypothetical protein QGG25_17625 [Phycisphaerae bacterium]|nr:hypothetical protein [Phycisphaerae bacterium]
MTCPQPTDTIEAPATAAGKICTVVQWTSLAAAIILGVTLSWRTITGADIGCHLAYGEHLLDTGQIVDSNMFIYTDATPQGDYAMDFAPSSWFDQQDRLRFPNVTWASQLILAATYRTGGPTGVCLLQAALVTILLMLVTTAMLRTGVRPWAAAIGVAIAALAVQARFMHRPELFGYVIMAAQLCILIGPRIEKYSLIALLALQCAFVQLHSSWLLGIFLTMCFLADRIARVLWARFITRSDEPADGQWKWLAGVLAGQLAMAFVSPWGWRTALLPLQMMWYLKVNNLMPAGQTGHPWSQISEMYPSLAPIFAGSVTSAAFVAALATAGLAAIGAIWTRRWSYLLLLGGMALMSMQVRRNIGPGVVILAPVSIAALWAAGAKLPGRWRRNRIVGLYGAALVSAATLLACSWFIFSVVTNRLYYKQGIGPRFGSGISRIDVPTEAGRYLKTLPRGTRVFTTFDQSSNVLYFSRTESGYLQVPVLGNGWACPPRNMDTVRQIAEGKKPFGPFARRYGVRAVVLKITRKSAYLAKFLYLSPQWRLRSLGARTVVFASTTADPSAPMMIDEESLAEKLRAMDPMPVYPLQAAARTLQLMEFYDLSIQMGRRAIEADSEYKGLWDVLGVSYAIRGKRKRSQRIAGAHEDFQQAKQCFVEALKRDPESRQLAAKLRQAELDLKKIDR